jgi:hypothetical protein
MRPGGKFWLAAAAAASTLALGAGGGAALASDQAGPAAASPAAVPAPAPAVFTPVTVTPLGPAPAPVPGTDGRYHLVYEYELTNTKAAPATIESATVQDANASGRVLGSWSGAALVGQLRTLLPAPATSAVIDPDVSRLLFIELSFPSRAAVPTAVNLDLHLLGASNPGATTATPLQYTVGRIAISPRALPVLSPPLAGAGWMAGNGCCTNMIAHRGAFQSIDGALDNGQRFAIDYMRVNAQGELVSGDPKLVTSYVDYNAKILAVASATVMSVENNLPNQTPGAQPNPDSFKTVEEVDGNQVTLNLGHGLYAFYAHMIKGSVDVHPGQHVHPGQVLGRLGNSGNTTAPHLHFQIMDAPGALASEGLPYVMTGFGLAGQINPATWYASPEITGVWAPGWTRNRVTQQNGRYPLDLNIVDFPSR